MQGKFKYHAGASGTVTLANGETVKQIVVHSTAGGTMTIFGGDSIPVIANNGFGLIFNHDNCVAGQTSGGSTAIIFTGTDSYYVATVGPGY